MSNAQYVRLRTAAWYGDQEVSLELPGDWAVETLWPRTPRPLNHGEITAALERPVGQRPVRELAVGKKRPVIIVDDLTRPTPANVVVPVLLRHFADSGLAPGAVTIVVGGGTHQAAGPQQILRKVGPEAAGCRLLAHDCTRDLVRVGRTGFGTPVLLNREVAAADLLVGVGGVYPQHSAGFGGGSKLILGVLGKRSIVALHYGHSSVSGTYNVDNDFRADLDQIAGLAGLRTTVTLHVDANRQVVRAVAGDQRAYYREAVGFSREAFAAPTPSDADVVIVNAYPMDVSLTFTRSKGMAPLYQAPPGASRVLVSACPEGLGYHGLFPFLNGPRFEREVHQLRRLSVIRPSALPGKMVRRADRAARAGLARLRQSGAGVTADVAALDGDVPPGHRHPIWFHPPGARPRGLPEAIPGLRLEFDWPEVLRGLQTEQAARDNVRALVYPCAPLTCLQWLGGERTGYLTESVAG